MLFNSYIFILFFLPVVILGWFTFNKLKSNVIAKIFLVAMSLWFYSYTNIFYLFLISGSIVFNFFISLFLKKINNNLGKRVIGIFGIVFNLGLLFYFKYYDFFISNINSLFKVDYTLLHIALPLGISFFTFQQISYVVDRVKGEAPHYNILDYAVFVSYFPQLVAGPIVKHSEMIPQFNDEKNRCFNYDNFAKGIVLFIVGLSKKIIIADNLALAVNYGYDNIGKLDTLGAIIVIFSYTMQIFFDFSGYCDMALGFGSMMNIKLPINFDSPYKSHSIKEFWNRWHITLNKFFTEYIYIPLGGSRKGKTRTAINVLIVFMLSGLWHGAAWTFVIWGLSHGVILSIERLDIVHIKNKFISWLLTFIFINLAWVLFRSDNFAMATEMYNKLCHISWNGSIFDISNAMDTTFLYLPLSFVKHFNTDSAVWVYIGNLVLILGTALLLCTRQSTYRFTQRVKYSWGLIIGLSICFMISLVSLASVSPFLYSNF